MSKLKELDELMRAADAAGYAMASMDDDPAAGTTAAAYLAEQLARGAQSTKTAVPADALARSVSDGAARGRLTSGAETVRSTVYGYLGIGIPA